MRLAFHLEPSGRRIKGFKLYVAVEDCGDYRRIAYWSLGTREILLEGGLGALLLVTAFAVSQSSGYIPIFLSVVGALRLGGFLWHSLFARTGQKEVELLIESALTHEPDLTLRPISVGFPKGSRSLTVTIDDSVDSSEVATSAFEAIVEACAKGNGHETYVASLPKQWRVVYTTISLDHEVMNGGFHQYFWNTEGRWNREVEESLETIGALPFLKLFREAQKIFAVHDYTTEKAKAGKSWELFSVGYKEKRMGDLDTTYFSENKSLPTFVGEYLKRNRSLYGN